MSSPEWTELCLEIAVEDTDRAAAIANMAVPYGIYIEDYSDLEQGARDIARIDLIDEGAAGPGPHPGADPFVHQPGGQSRRGGGLSAGAADGGGHSS